MTDIAAFRSGKDVGEETCVEDDDTVTCVDCGAVASDEAAYQSGWQLVPAVCPDCLRWSVVDETCCFGRPS